MTREEAIKILKEGLVNAPSEEAWCEAFIMAIKALEQEPVIEPLERLAESASKTAKVLERLSEQKPLTEENYIELNDRFGEYVVFIVKDMVSGKGERWKEWNKEWNDKPLAVSEPQERK